MRLRKKKFSMEDRFRILHECEISELSERAIALKYGIYGHSTLSKWRKKLDNCEKNRTFTAENSSQVAADVPMKKQTPEELEAEVKRLTKELEWAKLQNKALNTLIDIAEEQGIRIRKKSGAKQ